MNNEVKRYSLSIVIDNVQYKLFNSTLKNIDLLTTNFLNKSSLINFIKYYLSFPSNIYISDIKVTYYINETAKEVDLLFADKRIITDDKKIIESIGKYISYFSNVSRLNLEDLKEAYLLEKIRFLQSAGREPISKYNFAVKNICNHLNENYKVRRDFALYMNTQTKKVIPETEATYNLDEVKSILNSCDITSDQIYNIVNRVTSREQERLEEHHQYIFPSDYDSEEEREERRGFRK
jgi:hypothetical protein